MAKPNLIIALDIGSGTVKALAVARSKKDSELEVLGFAEEPSFGVRTGVIAQVPQVAENIKSLICKIEEQTKRKVDSVYVNVGGAHIFSTFSSGLVSVSRADQKVSKEDVDRVLQQARTISVASNKKILESIPRQFIINGEGGIKEPLGMQGVRLEAEVLILGCFAPYFNNLTSTILSSGLQINDVVISPLASSLAVLTPREKELGVAVLDIGARTSDLAVYKAGELVHAVVFPIGSAHITDDIAILLKTDIDVAERIKLEYGTLLYQGGDKKEKIKFSDEESLVFSLKQLSKHINDRISDIFGETNKELKKIYKQYSLPSGLVLTGGGSKIPKIKEMAKKELKLPCRLGKPQGFSPSQNDPRLATVCGLVLSALEVNPSNSESPQTLSRLKKIFKIFIP